MVGGGGDQEQFKISKGMYRKGMDGRSCHLCSPHPCNNTLGWESLVLRSGGVPPSTAVVDAVLCFADPTKTRTSGRLLGEDGFCIVASLRIEGLGQNIPGPHESLASKRVAAEKGSEH